MGTHARVSAWIIAIEAWRVNEVRVGVDTYLTLPKDMFSLNLSSTQRATCARLKRPLIVQSSDRCLIGTRNG